MGYDTLKLFEKESEVYRSITISRREVGTLFHCIGASSKTLTVPPYLQVLGQLLGVANDGSGEVTLATGGVGQFTTFGVLSSTLTIAQDKYFYIFATHKGWEVFAGGVASGGGGGLGDYPSKYIGGYDVSDPEFGALVDGVSHPLSAEAAADYNDRFGDIGLNVVAGDENDWAAIQAAYYKSAITGARVFHPFGKSVVNKPLTLTATATPIAGQPTIPLTGKIYGEGPGSIIYGKGIAEDRAVVEFLGESNPYAINLALEDVVVEHDASCDRYSWCIRAGDSWCGISLDRCIFRGANGIKLKVASSTSYANLCTRIDQCQVWTNWQQRWHASETTADVYALYPETGGSYWDNVNVSNSIFQGECLTRAFVLNFDNCQFFTPSNRPLNHNVVCTLGSISFTHCYFEDHNVAIATIAFTAPIASVRIVDCHFSGVNNNPPGSPHRAITCAPYETNQHGPLTVENCRFGPGYTYSHIDLYGPMTAHIRNNSCPFNAPINTGPTITKTPNVRMILHNPNGVLAEDTVEYYNVKIKVPKIVGPTAIENDVAGGAENKDVNPNTSASAYSARVVEANGFQGKLAAFGPTHALANQFWLYTVTDDPVVIGVNGAMVASVSNVGLTVAGAGRDGEYGITVYNVDEGTDAYAAVRFLQGQGKGAALLVFGENHALSGQSWLVTATADPLILGVNGSESMRIGSDGVVRLNNFNWFGGPFFVQTATGIVGEILTENSIVATGVGTVVIPPNFLKVGRIVNFKARGFLSSSGNPTLRIRCKVGDTVVADTGDVAQVGTPSNELWTLDVMVIVRSVGASGTCIAQGRFTYGNNNVPMLMTAPVALDTTEINLVDITAQWGADTLGNIISCTHFVPDLV